jgi:hypothetical protein
MVDELKERSGIDRTLSEYARDSLIAHGRQDASHAVANTSSLLKEVKTLRRLAWLNFFGVVLILWALAARGYY